MTQWDEDRKIIEASTPGPWEQWRDTRWVNAADGFRPLATCENGDEAAHWVADATFIAAARTRWPAALDALAAALERIAELEGELAKRPGRVSLTVSEVMEPLDQRQPVPVKGRGIIVEWAAKGFNWTVEAAEATYRAEAIEPRLLSQDKPNG